jgi:hypothetical protein
VNYLAQLAYPFGGHGTVVAWTRSIGTRLGLASRVERVRAALRPVHEAFERRLAALCLLSTANEDLTLAKRPFSGSE